MNKRLCIEAKLRNGFSRVVLVNAWIIAEKKDLRRIPSDNNHQQLLQGGTEAPKSFFATITMTSLLIFGALVAF